MVDTSMSTFNFSSTLEHPWKKNEQWSQTYQTIAPFASKTPLKPIQISSQLRY
jgi:hypothetical protein